MRLSCGNAEVSELGTAYFASPAYCEIGCSVCRASAVTTLQPTVGAVVLLLLELPVPLLGS